MATFQFGLGNARNPVSWEHMQDFIQTLPAAYSRLQLADAISQRSSVAETPLRNEQKVAEFESVTLESDLQKSMQNDVKQHQYH